MGFFDNVRDQFLNYYEALMGSLPKVITAVIAVLIFLFISRYIRRKLISRFEQNADDKLLVNFFNGIFRAINILLSLLIFLIGIGKGGIAGSILGAATFSSIVLGFAFKDIGENFLAGVIMAFNRPFRLGDTISSGGVEGVIIDMSIRETHIKTFDGKDVYIPNGQIIKNPLFNYTIDGYLRKTFSVGVEYSADLQEARKIIVDVVIKVPGIIKDEKPPFTLIKEFGSSSVNIVVMYWVNTFDKKHSGVEIQSAAMNNVLRALNTAGIGIPGTIIEIKNSDLSELPGNVGTE